MREPESAHLWSHPRIAVLAQRRELRQSEHADLLICVAQVRDLEHLRLTHERGVAVGAEESALDIEHVAAVARAHAVADVVEVDPPPRGLAGRQPVVERPDGVGRQAQLEDVVGERLHLLVSERALAPEEPGEGAVELAERGGDVRGSRPGWRRCDPLASAADRGSRARAGSAWSSGPSSTRSRSPAGRELDGIRVRLAFPSGSPRSHASPSRSPKTWQAAHDASPFAEVRAASKRSGRPRLTAAGSGSGSTTCPTSLRATMSITETPLSKRVAT